MMDELFKMLARGEMPNFLQVMQALSDVSELYPEGDKTAQDASGLKKSCGCDDLYRPDQRCSNC